MVEIIRKFSLIGFQEFNGDLCCLDVYGCLCLIVLCVLVCEKDGDGRWYVNWIVFVFFLFLEPQFVIFNFVMMGGE